MHAEDQFQIIELELFITRDGNGYVDERHLKTPEDFEYYKVLGKQTRYAIIKVSGILYLPHLIYETPTKNECYFASGVLRPTPIYQREFDTTYFKYVDDAERVLNNIRNFISWLKTVPKIKLPKAQAKKILGAYGHLIKDAPPTPEWERLSKIVFVGKKRSDLSPLAKDLAEEQDFVLRD